VNIRLTIQRWLRYQPLLWILNPTMALLPMRSNYPLWGVVVQNTCNVW